MKTKEEIFDWMAHIEHINLDGSRVYFQELLFDENGNAYDWDEQATRLVYDNYLASK